MSIFISIASYRDPELLRTVESIIQNASKPSELYFSIVVQDFEKDIPDLSWIPNLTLTTMHPKDARGAGLARSIAMSSYNKQDYYMQIDSHTLFAKDWDVIAITELEKAQIIANNKKIILSYYPPPFYVEGNGDISFPKKDKHHPAYPTRQKPFLDQRGNWTAKRINFLDSSMNSPELSYTLLAGFVFAPGQIVEEIPYDPEISFFGEEICFAVRSWTRGWDIYSPSKTICYHFYGRANYSKVWKDKRIRNITWKEIEDISRAKQKKVLCGIEQGIFGLGNYRNIKLYERMSGINFKEIYGLTK